jgi:hypothetical protein
VFLEVANLEMSLLHRGIQELLHATGFDEVLVNLQFLEQISHQQRYLRFDSIDAVTPLSKTQLCHNIS